MNATAADPRGQRLTLRRAAPTPVAAPPLPWRPARDVDGLQVQLIDLLETLPEMLLGPVVPLAISAGPALVAMSRPGCRTRTRKWITAWCGTAAYLHALAAPGAVRHDRSGRPVEPVEPDDQTQARLRLARMGIITTRNRPDQFHAGMTAGTPPPGPADRWPRG